MSAGSLTPGTAMTIGAGSSVSDDEVVSLASVPEDESGSTCSIGVTGEGTVVTTVGSVISGARVVRSYESLIVLLAKNSDVASRNPDASASWVIDASR